VPMRIRFLDLAEGERPQSDTARFSTVWTNDVQSRAFIDEAIHRWRRQIR